MSNNKKPKIDPNMLREAAAAISKSMSAEKAKEIKEQQVVEEVRDKLGNMPTVLCDSCGSYSFREATVFKRFSQDKSPTGEDMLAPVNTYECTKCGHINSEFLPSYIILDVNKKDRTGLPTY
jgi:transcriptional regulator NrdR family protein